MVSKLHETHPCRWLITLIMNSLTQGKLLLPILFEQSTRKTMSLSTIRGCTVVTSNTKEKHKNSLIAFCNYNHKLQTTEMQGQSAYK